MTTYTVRPGQSTKNLSRIIEKLTQVRFRSIRRRWQKFAVREVKTKYINSLKRGVSPVQRQGRFKKYSPVYVQMMKDKQLDYSKKPRPVNLKLSGELHDSFMVTKTDEGIKLEFTKTVGKKKWNLAMIHSVQGVGKAKTKRVIMPRPDMDDRLARAIIKDSEKKLKDLVKQAWK